MLLLAVSLPPVEAGGIYDSCNSEGEERYASCGYSCPTASKLYISVVSHDGMWPYADVSGSTSCGDEDAACGRTPKQCEDWSNGLTREGGYGGCTGRTHEAWASGLTVYCKSTGAEDCEGDCGLLPRQDRDRTAYSKSAPVLPDPDGIPDTVREELARLLAEAGLESFAYIYVDTHFSGAWVLVGEQVQFVEPTCQRDLDGLVCSIGTPHTGR